VGIRARGESILYKLKLKSPFRIVTTTSDSHTGIYSGTRIICAPSSLETWKPKYFGIPLGRPEAVWSLWARNVRTIQNTAVVTVWIKEPITATYRIYEASITTNGKSCQRSTEAHRKSEDVALAKDP
jgi:hypothetical protein